MVPVDDQTEAHGMRADVERVDQREGEVDHFRPVDRRDASRAVQHHDDVRQRALPCDDTTQRHVERLRLSAFFKDQYYAQYCFAFYKLIQFSLIRFRVQCIV